MIINEGLNLNRQPIATKNGSVVDANNMILDKDGIYNTESILEEDTISPMFKYIDNSVPKTIKYLLPNNEELYVFYIHNDKPNELRLCWYELTDGNNDIFNTTNIVIDYNNGKIKALFNLIKADKVIMFTEFDGEKEDTLKCINVTKNTCILMNEKINLPQTKLTVVKGCGLKGWYYFFIRYKISDNNYTKWFNLFQDSILDETAPVEVHKYYYEKGDNYLDFKSQIIRVGSNKDYCNYTLCIGTNSVNNSKYNTIQYGIVIINKTSTKYYRSNDMDYYDNFIFNKKDVIEYNDEILINYDSYFDVKDLLIANSQLYIGNFKEHSKFDENDIILHGVLNIASNRSISNDIVEETVSRAYVPTSDGSKIKYTITEGNQTRTIKLNLLFDPIEKQYYIPIIQNKKYTPNSVILKNNKLGYITPVLDGNDYRDTSWHFRKEKYYDSHYSRPFEGDIRYYPYKDGGIYKFMPYFGGEYWSENLYFDGSKTNANEYDYIVKKLISNTDVIIADDIYEDRAQNPHNHDSWYSILKDLDFTNDYDNPILPPKPEVSVDDGETLSIINSNNIQVGQYYKFYFHIIDQYGNTYDGIPITFQKGDEEDENGNYVYEDYVYVGNDINTINDLIFTNDLNIHLSCSISSNIYKKLGLVTKKDNGEVIYPSIAGFISCEKVDSPIKLHGYLTKDEEHNEIKMLSSVNLETDETISIDINKYVREHQLIAGNASTWKYNLKPAASPGNYGYETRMEITTDILDTIDDYYILINTNKIDNKEKHKQLIPCSSLTSINSKYGCDCIINPKNAFATQDYYIRINNNIYDEAKERYGLLKGLNNTAAAQIETIPIVGHAGFSNNLPNEFLIYNGDNNNRIVKDSVMVNDGKDERESYYVNTILTSLNVSDIFTQRHLPRFDSYPVYYTNMDFDTDDEVLYSKTIRRSNKIQDESNHISYNYFNIENYKLIADNTGEIIKLSYVTDKLLVHCKNALIYLNGSNDLQANDGKIQLNEADLFEMNYKIICDYGINDRYEAIDGQFGYVFYNKKTHNIYQLNNGLNIISNDIRNYLFTLDDYNLKIVDDVYNDRLLFIFYNKDSKQVLSYNYRFNKWISKHNYGDFDDVVYYYNKLYFVKNDNIYSFGNSYNRCNISILFNESYETIKVIDYIKYKLYAKNDNLTNVDGKPIFNKIEYYAGDSMRVISEFCDTNNMYFYEQNDTSVNNINNITQPAFRFGNYHVNVLRNKRDEVINGDVNYEDANMIYGNWFVVNFEFNINKQVVVESIDCKYSPDIL